MSKSSTTIKGVATPRRVTTYPGEVLSEEFLKPLGMSVNALAMALRVPATRVGAIVKCERSVTADTALGWRAFSAPPRVLDFAADDARPRLGARAGRRSSATCDRGRHETSA
jgi:addiction module HigA family antidote